VAFDASRYDPHMTADPGESQPRMRVAATRDVATAERWCDALEAEGIDSLIEFGDERTAMPGQNVLVGEGGSPSSVVYSITVTAAEHEHASAVLAAYNHRSTPGAEAGEEMSTTTMLRGALIVVGLVFAFFVVIILLDTI
jgi:hypothetical protein